MKEEFLHYLWQHQYFKTSRLMTVSGAVLEIEQRGYLNVNAGPDFLNATLKINGFKWIGNVEMHLKPNLWYQHQHHHDKRYNNVILHVVWEGKDLVKNQASQVIETLELRNLVDEKLLKRYNGFETTKPILCQSYFKIVGEDIIENTLRKQLFKRFETKAQNILERLKAHRNNWEHTLFETIGSNFGLPVNRVPFERLARLIDYKIVAKHRIEPFEIEALVFGLAGFLQETQQPNEYFSKLQNSYRFLKHKYQFDFNLKREDWFFKRLRPSNFPTIRLAQLVQFFVQTDKIFRRVLDSDTADKLKILFKLQQNSYWQEHYDFGKRSAGKLGALGDTTQEILIINAVVPVLFARSKFEQKPFYLNYGVQLLGELKAENHKITRLWRSVGQKLNSAYDSQAHYALYRQACEFQKCLDCAIGQNILKV